MDAHGCATPGASASGIPHAIGEGLDGSRTSWYTQGSRWSAQTGAAAVAMIRTTAVALCALSYEIIAGVAQGANAPCDKKESTCG